MTCTHANAGIAFGGGVYRCPGRFFAEMEVALLCSLLVAHRDITFVTPTAQPSISTHTAVGKQSVPPAQAPNKQAGTHASTCGAAADQVGEAGVGIWGTLEGVSGTRW